ncbi:hypothetical protein D3C87_2163190 [compost metagenome]
MTSEAILISVLAWTTNAEFGFVVSDFYENIKKAFRDNQISIPALRREIIIEKKSIDNPAESKNSFE